MMAMQYPEPKKSLNELVRELARNITRKQLVAIAREHGWRIVQGGKEPFKAIRDGYACVSISGHHDNAIINRRTAARILKLLLEPTFDNNLYPGELEDKLAFLLQELESQREKAEQVECQLQQALSTIVTLSADVEAGLALADETEQRNHALCRDLNRYSRWVAGLKRKVAALIQQRAEQEQEMLAIAEVVERKEMNEHRSVEKLKQIKSKLNPQLRAEIQQVIRWLTEEN